MIILHILCDYTALSPLEVEINENIAIFQENIGVTWDRWPGFGKPQACVLGRGRFLCFSATIDQRLIRESFGLVWVTGEKPGLRTGQVTGSVRRSRHRGQTAQQRTELCPTAPSVMLGHTAITLLLHNTGAECTPPRHKNTHSMPPSWMNASSSHHRLSVGGSASPVWALRERVGPSSAPVPPKQVLEGPRGPFCSTELTSKTTAREWEHHIYSKLPHRQHGTSVLKLCNISVAWDYIHFGPRGERADQEGSRNEGRSG